MYYRIGIVAELFGLTGETLRNYEKAGLIESHREEGSAYRHYDINTIAKLVGIRSLRSEGFSIDELQKVYTDISIDQVHQLVKEKIALRERELTLSMALYDQLRRQEEALAQMKAGDCFSLGMSPAMYLLAYRDNEILNIDGVKTGRLAQWARNLFLVLSYMRYTEDLKPLKGEGFNAALAVPADLVSLLEIDVSPPVRFESPKLCVRCLCERRDGGDPYGHVRPELGDYMERQGVRQKGEPFSITLFSFHSKGKKHSCMCLFVPVSRND